MPTSATLCYLVHFVLHLYVSEDGWIYCSIRKKWKQFFLSFIGLILFVPLTTIHLMNALPHFPRTQRNAKEWTKVLWYGYRIQTKNKKKRGKRIEADHLSFFVTSSHIFDLLFLFTFFSTLLYSQVNQEWSNEKQRNTARYRFFSPTISKRLGYFLSHYLTMREISHPSFGRRHDGMHPIH